MRVISKRDWGLLVGIMLYASIPNLGGALRVLELVGGPGILPENVRAHSHPIPILLHILSSVVFLILGATQFLESVRVNFPNFHKGSGYLVVLTGIVSAATGLWMSVFFVFPEDLQGGLLFHTRVLVSSSMIWFLIWAIVAIRSKQVKTHRAAMLRAYALGHGASTQSLVGLGWMMLFGDEPAVPNRDLMMCLAWLFNVVLAEVFIQVVWKNRGAGLVPNMKELQNE